MSAQIKARHLNPNPHLKVLKNVNIVVLKVMTLTIVNHCIYNYVFINLPTIRVVKAKEDMEEEIIFNLKAKP